MFVMKLCCLLQEDEYVTLAAMHYSIQFGPAYKTEDVQKAVEECIADELIESRGMAKWIDLIGSAHLQVCRRCIGASGQSRSGDPCVMITQAPRRKSKTVKQELVYMTRLKWPLCFSRFYEVTMVSGEPRHHLS